MNFKKAALVWLVVSLMRTNANQGSLWRAVKVSQSFVAEGAKQNGSINIHATTSSRLSKISCSIFCQKLDWCDLWCPDPSSPNSCLLFGAYVVPGYQESNMADALNCFTRRPKDFAVHAMAIEGPVPYGGYSKCKKENMLDGKYAFTKLDDCYFPSYSNSPPKSPPYFMIDLGSVKPVRQIMVVLENGRYAQDTKDIEFRVGNSSSDVISNKFFGYYPGPSSANDEVFVTVDIPIWGRFVSGHRICKPGCKMVLCHIEIN